MKIKKLMGALFIGLLFIVASCEYVTIVPVEVDLGDEEVLFSTQVAPIFDEVGCALCHTASRAPDLRIEYSYASLTGGNYLNIEDPASSPLVVKILGGHPSPDKLTAKQMALLKKWIEQGAKDN